MALIYNVTWKPVIQILYEKSGIFKQNQHAKVEYQGQDKRNFCRAALRVSRNQSAEQIIEQRTHQQQPDENGFAPCIKDKRTHNQYSVAVTGFCHIVRNQRQGQKEIEKK